MLILCSVAVVDDASETLLNVRNNRLCKIPNLSHRSWFNPAQFYVFFGAASRPVSNKSQATAKIVDCS